MWDLGSDLVVISTKGAFVFGINFSAQITGQEVLYRIHADDRDKVTAALTDVVPENPFIQAWFRVNHPERGIIWVEMNSSAFFDDAGKILRITGAVSDVTSRKLAEIELAEANERLSLAMIAGKSIGWDWDVRSGRNTFFGDLQNLLGIPGKSHAGHIDGFIQRVHPEDRERVWKAIKTAEQGQTPYTAEFRVLREDGVQVWLSAQGKFSYRNNDEPERMSGIAVDITERKNAQEALRNKDQELAEAQHLAGVGSWRWNPKDDTVIWSEELYRIVGRDTRLPAVTYAEHSKIYTPESWERLRLAVEEALRSGTQYELELELVRPDGTPRWVIARGETQKDYQGRVVGLHGTLQDITERRRAGEALRESEERLRLAAQAGRMYAYEWDRASDVIVRSAEFTHILGLSSEPTETTCRERLMTIHPDDRARVNAVTYGCTPRNPSCRVRYRVLRSDGSVVWLEKNARAYFDEKGELQRMIGMIADISERKLAEEAISSVNRRLIEVQEAERARIARELHDDISQRLALLSVSFERVKRTVPVLQSELRRRMDELREQVVDISSSIHALSHELHSSKLRHLDTINAMRGFCTELSAQQNVEIGFVERDVPESIPQEISICLFRVLQEALHNAVKHSQAHRFEVELQGSPDTICLSIHDSGLGFDPKEAMNGRGLGLTSMQERVKLVNGEFNVDSQPGHGTTLHARVPLLAVGKATFAR